MSALLSLDRHNLPRTPGPRHAVRVSPAFRRKHNTPLGGASGWDAL